MERLDGARTQLRARGVCEPRVALVLGSGLGGLSEALSDSVVVPYGDIAGMPSVSVAGHPGELVSGLLEGLPVIMMRGRVHMYEGYSPAQVVFGVRLMLHLGASTLVVTNAAGGLDAALQPGSLLRITDHLNLSARNCLVGPESTALGPRFPDMSQAYDAQLGELCDGVARSEGVPLATGVYAGVLGPNYETPAEVRMLAGMGASVVGMSTVQEVIAAHHMGARVLGLSCVTNAAAGLLDGPLRHEDVQRAALNARTQLEALVRGVLRRMAAA